jgi:hypothetical protein
LHVDTGSITPGPNGTAEMDVPLANIGNPPLGSMFEFPTTQSYVRLGILAAPLEPVDGTSAGISYLLAGDC